nr:MAG TPA: restriction alleviation protein [Caudoviricetes sp.]
MTDKVLCPYCGSEMKSEDWVKVDGGYLSYAVCSNDACQSIGPTVTGYETMAEARAAALSAAQARYLPPNRPLTLEEVNALPADDDGYIPGFLEIEPNWYAQDTDDFEPRLRADAICKEALGCETCNKDCETYNKDCETYNKHYRVWLRKPTQKEMDAAGWGDAE